MALPLLPYSGAEAATSARITLQTVRFRRRTVTQRSGDPNAGHPPTGGLRVESPPIGGLGFESLRSGILGGPDLDDARSSLSESLRGGAVTPRTWRFHVVTIVARQIQMALDCREVSPSTLNFLFLRALPCVPGMTKGGESANEVLRLSH